MLSILVLFSFFVLLFILLYEKDSEKRLLILLISLFCFPASAVAFSKSPFLDPKSLMLYAFFFIEILQNSHSFYNDFKKFPFLFPCLIFFSSMLLTSYFVDFSFKRIYDATRIFIDSFGFMVAIFITASRINVERFFKKISKLILVFGILAIIESLLDDNYPYKIICSAFPYYNGFLDLNGTINFDQEWRSRINLLTKHPTTLGTLATIGFFFYLPWKTKENRDFLLKCSVLVSLLYIAFASGSRTTLFCIGLFSFVYFLLNQRLIFKIIFILVTTATCSLYVYDFINSILYSGKGSSLELREEQLAYSVVMMSNSLYFGNGINYIEKNLIEENSNGRKQVEDLGGLESIIFTHSINQGLWGLISYFIFMSWMIIYFYKKRKSNKFAIQGFLITSSSYLFFLISGHIGSNEIMAYSLIGLCAGAISYEDELKTKTLTDGSSD